MNQGVIIGDRYRLESPVDSAIPFAESWRAWDRRLGSFVLLLLVAEEGRKGFQDVAAHARMARHPRLTRILETGLIESSELELAGQPYVVFDEPEGIGVADLLIRHRLPTPVARALMGETLESVEAAARVGLRHGAISPRLLTVTVQGRVLLTGAGIAAGLLASDPSREPVADHDDALALVRCFVQAVTGMDPDDTAPEDLPRDLTRAERDLSLSVIGLPEVLSFADLRRAFPSRNPRALRDLRTRRPSFPRCTPLGVSILGPEPTLPEGSPALVEAPPVEVVRPEYDLTEAVEEGLVEEGWGFEDFEEVSPDREVPTIAEAFFGFLHRRFPSWSLGRSLYERARDHTLAGPRFDATPWFLLLGLVVVIVVGILSIGWATGPFTPTVDLNNLPSHEYPSFTFGPTGDPSAGS